jgi:acetyl-CoA carboxylase biotin carboxyl carrier protein
MNLSHQDIQAILRILDASPYDELRLDNAEFSLYLKRSADGWTQEQQTLKATANKVVDAAKPVLVTEPAASEAGLVDIRAPIVGTFYRAPQPGADPFVEVGSKVDPDSVIAIIEVMKLMSSIPALTGGTVREILAQDAQFVEKGQLLMRVKPGSSLREN